MEEKKVVKGYKVFNSDWTCSPNGNSKQYTCPGKFEEDGELDICGHGMHFCENAADCFNYYRFDSNNKVAEVIAYGTVLKKDDKSCTDKLEIVREVPWDELLRIVNTGKNCTGLGNTGDNNAGDNNTGDWNTGNGNAGNWNTGNWNAGNSNTGYGNTGNYNTGDGNTGDGNTGDNNAGDLNTGNSNSGHNNTGNGNIGNKNTGVRNTGSYNTGDWNKSSFNTGCFMTEEQKIPFFNKPSEWNYEDWIQSDARRLLNLIPINTTKWIYSEDMTDEEKTAHPTHETKGGYLKVLDESECAQDWWDNLSEPDRNIIRAIPNFDSDIFEEITGIKTE